jgi:hypothetical protein
MSRNQRSISNLNPAMPVNNCVGTYIDILTKTNFSATRVNKRPALQRATIANLNLPPTPPFGSETHFCSGPHDTARANLGSSKSRSNNTNTGRGMT